MKVAERELNMKTEKEEKDEKEKEEKDKAIEKEKEKEKEIENNVEIRYPKRRFLDFYFEDAIIAEELRKKNAITGKYVRACSSCLTHSHTYPTIQLRAYTHKHSHTLPRTQTLPHTHTFRLNKNLIT